MSPQNTRYGDLGGATPDDQRSSAAKTPGAQREAVVGGTNFVLFDFRALTTFDEREPRVVTLSDTGSMRLSLIMFRAGQSFAPQPLASEAIVQALRGRLRLSVANGEANGEASTELRAGRLAQVEARTPFRLHAISDAVVLLSVAPSPGAALRSDAGPLVTRA